MSYNLRRRKGFPRQLRRLFRLTGRVRRSVLLLQEAAARSRKRGCLRVKGGDAFVSEGGDVAVGIPREWMPLVRQVSLEKREWVGVQLADTAYFSAHLPPVASVASVGRAEEILDEISVQVQRWRDSRLKAPKWVVLGVDANVRVPAAEEGRTGDVVWSRELQSTLHRRQTMALMTFASAHNLKLANTFAWSYEGCRPPGRRQARPHTKTRKMQHTSAS